MSPTSWGVFIALIWALGGAVLAWAVTYPLHRRSLGWLLASVAFTGMVSTVASVLGSVRAMSLPGNYQAQTILVALVAGLVASGFAALRRPTPRVGQPGRPARGRPNSAKGRSPPRTDGDWPAS